MKTTMKATMKKNREALSAGAERLSGEGAGGGLGFSCSPYPVAWENLPVVLPGGTRTDYRYSARASGSMGGRNT
eukprot:6788668-Prymnesium_polylepis.1